MPLIMPEHEFSSTPEPVSSLRSLVKRGLEECVLNLFCRGATETRALVSSNRPSQSPQWLQPFSVPREEEHLTLSFHALWARAVPGTWSSVCPTESILSYSVA
jgi:hypothetical protein